MNLSDKWFAFQEKSIRTKGTPLTQGMFYWLAPKTFYFKHISFITSKIQPQRTPMSLISNPMPEMPYGPKRIWTLYSP